MAINVVALAAKPAVIVNTLLNRAAIWPGGGQCDRK